MGYKSAIRENELLTKLKILRMTQVGNHSHKKVASTFGCHRNTVANIINSLDKIPKSDQEILLSSTNLSLEEINKLMVPMLAQPSSPHSHPKSATPLQAGLIYWFHYKRGWKVGYRYMQVLLKRSFYDYEEINEDLYSLSQLTLRQVRTVYQNYGLKIKKVRTTNGKRTPLYDYKSLSTFERMHLDVKVLPDQHSLPPDVYLTLKNKKIPKYQWTLIDAKTRVRFVAYSYNINSEFGLKFLLFVICFIRFTFNNWETEIVVGMDNGLEFCRGSETKLAEWNQILLLLNTRAYQYSPYFDVRKNLVERSHRVDDTHFLVPRGLLLINKQIFLEEVTNFFHFYNFIHPNSGIGMDDKTPYEVLSQTKLPHPERLIQFPVMILEEHITTIRKTVDSLLFQTELKQKEEKQGKLLNQKQIIDISIKYDFFDENAQKVLTQYRKSVWTIFIAINRVQFHSYIWTINQQIKI